MKLQSSTVVKYWTLKILAVCIKILIKQYFLLFFLYAQLVSEALVRNNLLLRYHAIAYDCIWKHVADVKPPPPPPTPHPPPPKIIIINNETREHRTVH